MKPLREQRQPITYTIKKDYTKASSESQIIEYLNPSEGVLASFSFLAKGNCTYSSMYQASLDSHMQHVVLQIPKDGILRFRKVHPKLHWPTVKNPHNKNILL